MDTKVTYKDQILTIDDFKIVFVNNEQNIKVSHIVNYDQKELTKFDNTLYIKVVEIIGKGEYPLICFNLYNHLMHLFIVENESHFLKLGLDIRTMNPKLLEKTIMDFHDCGKIQSQNQFASHVINYDDYRLCIQNCILKIDPFFDNHILYTAEGTYLHVKNLDGNTLGTVVGFIMQPEYTGRFTGFKNYMQRVFNLCHPNPRHPYNPNPYNPFNPNPYRW